MKVKTTHIFLAGGGSAEASRLLDKRFVETLDHRKPLVYIPNAMKSRSYQSCLEWFRSVMTPLDLTKVEMWDDLRPRCAATSIAGVYIGGGDTAKLLKELRAAGFNNYLLEVANAGVPLYGGSAGAIILGEDVRTAPEAKNLDASEAMGLKIVRGHSMVCHYNASEETSVLHLAQTFGHNILAIPEKAGGHLTSNVLTNYGIEPISIFQDGEVIGLEPNRSTSLLTRR